MKAVILAGGKGTRLGSLTRDVPKPMVEIAGKPLLAYQLEMLQRYGVSQVFVTTGYLAEIIEDFCENNDFGLEVVCVHEETPLGTSGGVATLKDDLNQDFLVLYGDLFFDIDLRAFYRAHQKNQGIATLFSHPNDHPWDSDLLVLGAENRILDIHKKPHGAHFANMSNAALYVLSPAIFDYIVPGQNGDFMHDVFPLALKNQEQLYAYNSAEYVKDMGTPERLAMVERAIVSGKVARLSTRKKRLAIFIDRDGTLVEHVDQLHKLQDLQLLPGAADAVRKLNGFGVLAVLVTNQSVIARNLCTLAELDEIHNEMEWLLADDGGGYLDAIYFCPHHPDAGYPEENKEYKVACACRKPATGMLEAACLQFNIDIDSSWIIGDSSVDIQAGKNMGTKSALVLTGQGRKYREGTAADIIAHDLNAAVDKILSVMESYRL